MRRGTLITLVLMFLVLIGAAIYQLTLGNDTGEPLCGPQSPEALPTQGACPSNSPS